MAECIFCAIAFGEASAVRVFEDQDTVAFMDINPATRGHALVIPKRHARDLVDVPVPDLQAMAATAHLVGQAAVAGLGAAGVNLMLSSGRAAFQTVFHIHFHVIPRYKEDGLRLPWVPAPGDLAEVAAAGGLIRSAVSSSVGSYRVEDSDRQPG